LIVLGFDELKQKHVRVFKGQLCGSNHSLQRTFAPNIIDNYFHPQLNIHPQHSSPIFIPNIHPQLNSHPQYSSPIFIPIDSLNPNPKHGFLKI